MEFEKLKKIIAEVLNVDEEEITMETTFVDDLGADSLDIFQIIMGIEEEFDIEIANEDAEHIRHFCFRKMEIGKIQNKEEYLPHLFKDEIRNYLFRKSVNATSMLRMEGKEKCAAYV